MNNITKERMYELINIIEQANYDYHVLDDPKITDQEYDAAFRELEKSNSCEKYIHFVWIEHWLVQFA